MCELSTENVVHPGSNFVSISRPQACLRETSLPARYVLQGAINKLLLIEILLAFNIKSLNNAMPCLEMNFPLSRVSQTKAASCVLKKLTSNDNSGLSRGSSSKG